MSAPEKQPTEAAVPQPSISDAIKSSLTSAFSSPAAIAYIVVLAIILLLPAIGAAKLSHDRYGSIGWAILAFIFNPFYYVYYAYFVSTKYVQQPILGGRRRR